MMARTTPSPGLVPRALFVALVSGLAIAACGRIPGQFQIVNDQVPKAGCLIPVDETIYAGQGRLDLSLVKTGAGSAYFVFPMLKNNLPGSTSGPDANRIVMSSFAVDIAPIGPASTENQQTYALFNALNGDHGAVDYALLHYQTPWSGSVASDGGKISASVAAFPVELAARIRGIHEIGLSPSLLVNLRIRAFGNTTTESIESDPFDFPVAVCSGCLVANVQSCPYAAAPTNAGNPCNAAQDDPVDCCMSGNDLVCPPAVTQ